MSVFSPLVGASQQRVGCGHQTPNYRPKEYWPHASGGKGQGPRGARGTTKSAR